MPRERPVTLALLSLTVAACTWISIDLTRVAGSVASVWIANGIATSIGIAYATSVGSGHALIALADKALYDARTAGRNTYRMIED